RSSFGSVDVYTLPGYEESVTYGKHKQYTQWNPVKWVGSSAILCQKSRPSPMPITWPSLLLRLLWSIRHDDYDLLACNLALSTTHQAFRWTNCCREVWVAARPWHISIP